MKVKKRGSAGRVFGGFSKYVQAAFFAAVVLVALGGCTGPYEEEEEREERGEIVCVDEMFVEVGEEGGERETEFRTNDKRYWRWEGVTVWTVWGDEGVEGEFERRTVKMGKMTGYAGGGYGIVLCQGEREVGGKEEKTMLVVMINNRGEYLIGEVIGSRFMGYGWWEKSESLKGNAGAENEVAVLYDEAEREFGVYFNGSLCRKFRDEEEPVHRGGKNGYVVVITPYDRFPEEAVDVHFKEER